MIQVYNNIILRVKFPIPNTSVASFFPPQLYCFPKTEVVAKHCLLKVHVVNYITVLFCVIVFPCGAGDLVLSHSTILKLLSEC